MLRHVVIQLNSITTNSVVKAFRGPQRSISRCFSVLSKLDLSSNDGIAVLTLNNINSKNALGINLLNELDANIENLLLNQRVSDVNSRIRALIITSAIPGVFCPGADLKERLKMPPDAVGPFVDRLRTSFDRIATLPVPTIAAIEGVALGGGLELALACDLRIAGVGSQLGLPETALAIIPGAGGTQRLSRIIGTARSKELIFLGKRVSSTEAASIGLITESVPQGKALERARELAAIIAEKGPIAIAAAKEAIDKGSDLSLQDGLSIEKDCYARVIYTSDRLEGLRSFTEKRKPSYTGC